MYLNHAMTAGLGMGATKRSGFWFPALILLSVAEAGAQTPAPKPIPLPAPRPDLQRGPAAAAIARTVQPTKRTTIDAATAVKKANVFFNTTVVTTADFVQLGPDGRRSEGKLYIQKPGRIRFEYAPPATLQIISDGSSVAIRDRKLATQDLYFVAQTPLKFLLKDKIDIATDLRILDVASNDESVSIVVEDKATFGGTSQIRLVFDPIDFGLRQWTVTDPQGYNTVVSLMNIDTKSVPDPDLFRINYERFKD